MYASNKKQQPENKSASTKNKGYLSRSEYEELEIPVYSELQFLKFPEDDFSEEDDPQQRKRRVS